MHQPFIFYKIINIELYAVAFEYLLLFFLIHNSKKIYKLNDFLPLGMLFVLALPFQFFIGNFNYKYEFAIRLFPLIVFLILINDAKEIFLKSTVYFLCLNIILNILMFNLFKLEFPAIEVSTETGLHGVTLYYLSFAVSTAFFTTGDPFLARLQGWAWEPAAFALSCLPLILMPLKIWKILFSKNYKIYFGILSVGVILTKSIAAFLSIILYFVIKKRNYAILIIVIGVLISSILIDQDDIAYFINNSSLDVRIEQATQFYNSLNFPLLIFGYGYASEQDLGLDTGQTSIISRYIIYFGLIKIIMLFLLMYFYFIRYLKISQLGFNYGIIVIFISLISLDISLSNIFVGLMISILGLLYSYNYKKYAN
jgi:hypothetical protein